MPRRGRRGPDWVVVAMVSAALEQLRWEWPDTPLTPKPPYDWRTDRWAF